MTREYVVGSARAWANGRITWSERDTKGVARLVSVVPDTFPLGAPDAVRELAERSWGAETIQFIKDRASGARPKPEGA